MVLTNYSRLGARHVRQVLVLFVACCAAVAFATGAAWAQDASRPPVLAVFGDSLVDGYGVARSKAFPAQLEEQLHAVSANVEVINLGVSGDTSAALKARLLWSLPAATDAVFIEIGGNDALRGIDAAETRRNLVSIITTLQDRGLPIFLSGMRSPPSMGELYVSEFDAIFPSVAMEFAVTYDPFFLEGVAGETALNQRDQIHPTVEGIGIIAKRLREPVIDFLIERGLLNSTKMMGEDN